MKIIAVEGSVFAGKSTLINQLATRLDAIVIQEYGVYLKGSHAFPAFPPKTRSDAIAADHFFMQVEKLRLDDLRRSMASQVKQFVLIDRTYLTCLAFDYAAKMITKFDVDAEVSGLWAKSEKIEPDAWIYLKADAATIASRTHLRPSKCLPHLLDPGFINEQHAFFVNFSSGGRSWLTIDARLPKEEVARLALAFVLQQ